MSARAPSSTDRAQERGDTRLTAATGSTGAAGRDAWRPVPVHTTVRAAWERNREDSPPARRRGRCSHLGRPGSPRKAMPWPRRPWRRPPTTWGRLRQTLNLNRRPRGLSPPLPRGTVPRGPPGRGCFEAQAAAPPRPRAPRGRNTRSRGRTTEHLHHGQYPLAGERVHAFREILIRLRAAREADLRTGAAKRRAGQSPLSGPSTGRRATVAPKGRDRMETVGGDPGQQDHFCFYSSVSLTRPGVTSTLSSPGNVNVNTERGNTPVTI